jgi:CDGSH-type Zn-finger protein
MVITNLP